MTPMKKILLVILGISLLTFIALFGRLPALRRTPIGWLQRALCIHVPHGFRLLDQRATGGKLTVKSRRLGRYLFYEKNPVVLILFLILLTGSAGLFLYAAVARLETRHLVPIPLLLFLPYYFTYLCVDHKAHHITYDNIHARARDYPYDYVIFRPGNVCATCNIVKLARSKHCSLCGHCVAKCDHHCPWVNNCLGRGNYRYFLALLLSLTAIQFYGTYLSYWILSPYLHLAPQAKGLPLFSWQKLAAFGDMCTIAIEAGGLGISGVGLLAAATAALPLALLVYHLYLIWAGMTTNESSKWADWGDDMGDGVVFRSSKTTLLKHMSSLPPESGNHALIRSVMGGDPSMIGNFEIRWPVRSDQAIVRTNDGKPPAGQAHLWDRIWNLSEVENIYDLGGWDNFMCVMKGQ